MKEIQVPNITEEITEETWSKKFKTWKEYTQTSPSGLHLGHYKLLHTKMYLQKEDTVTFDTEIQAIQQELFLVTLQHSQPRNSNRSNIDPMENSH